MTMTRNAFSVQCPSCDTWFPVDPDRVPQEGVSAICSSCLRVFRVERPADSAPTEVASGQEEGIDALPASEPAPRPREEPAADEHPQVEATPEVAMEPPVEDAEPELEPEIDAAAEPESESEPEPEVQIEASAEPEPETEREPAPEPDPQPESPTRSATPVEEQSLSRAASRFGRRDPHDRARKLARVLVSDMITYHPQRYEEAAAEGTLKEHFEEEIRLSWEEYEEQIGREIAESTDYFIRALNEILARGEPLFGGIGRPE